MLFLIALAILVPTGVFSQDPVAFFVSKSTDADASDPLEFENVHLNVGNGFDPDTSTFTVPATGHYMFALSAGAAYGSSLEIEIVQPTNVASNIIRENSNTNGTDTESRIIILNLQQDDVLHVKTETPVASEGEAILTSWGGFLIEAMLGDDHSIFSATTNRSHSTVMMPIFFEDIEIDVGGNYDMLAGGWQAPHNCTVFASYSVAVEPDEVLATNFKGDHMSTELTRMDTSHNGIDVATRAVFMELVMYDYVYVDLWQGEVFGDNRHQTSLVGFMYEPANEADLIAFSVNSIQSLNVGEDYIDLTFPVIRSTEGDLWDAELNRAVCSVPGVYFFQADMSAREHNIYFMVDVDLIQVVEGVENIVGGVRRTSSLHNESDGVSRGFFIHMAVGDEVFLRGNPMSGLFSDTDGQLVFTGILVYPDA
jgi:hypothetical protein